MKFGFTPALNAQHAYVCRDSYALRCLIPARFKMKFQVEPKDPGPYQSPPLPFLAVSLGTNTKVHSSTRVLPNSRRWTLTLCCFPSLVYSIWFLSACIAASVRFIVLMLLSVFGGVKWPFIAMFRLIVIVQFFVSIFTALHPRCTPSMLDHVRCHAGKPTVDLTKTSPAHAGLFCT